MSETPEMLRRLAAAEEVPLESDAPANGENPVPYDPGLQQQLLELGPETLAEFGVIVVRDVADPARYNSAVWYALGHDLAYELKDNTVVITDTLKPEERNNVRSRP